MVNMKYDPNIHHRRSIRLKGYDYSQPGAYFVTICTHQRICNLGKIVDGKMVVNQSGSIVQTVWDELPKHYLHVELDEFCIMPNHVHCIIVLVDGNGGRGRSETSPYHRLKRHGLPEIVRALKSFSSRRINELKGTQGTPFWQRNYYERIIRTQRHLNSVRKYIRDNPLKWERDRNHPHRRI